MDLPENKDASLQDAQIEAILLHEDTLLPSSGFAARVMESIESTEHANRSPWGPSAPIRFPWKRASIGLAAVWAPILFFAARTAASLAPDLGGQGFSVPGALQPMLASPLLHQAFGPALLALAGSYLSVWIAQFLATPSGKAAS